MDAFLSQFGLQFSKSFPLFLLIALGFALSRWGHFPKSAGDGLSKFAFNVALPAMLFRIISQMFRSDTTADLRLLIAFFGSCFIVFFLGRIFASKILRTEPVGGIVFGTACVFSNNGLLGLPLALVMLGDQYVPSVAAVLSINAMVLWTLASFSAEFARSGNGLTMSAVVHTLKIVFRNPLIVSIFAGALWNLTRIVLPPIVDEPLRLLANSATPLALVVVGMGLSEYGIGKGIRVGGFITAGKLLVQPCMVFLLTQLIGLGPIETTAVVFLGSLPCGVNVYLMAKEFRVIEPEVANAMVFTTVLSSFTVPVVVTGILHYVGS